MDKEALLMRAQQGIDLVERPYEKIAQDLGVDEDEVLQGLQEMVQEKLIRSLAPIYDTRKMGYDSALVAFQVKPERLEDAAKCVSGHPGVSHNYERPHDFNLWFTLAVSPTSMLGLGGTVRLLAEHAGADASAILRSKKTFKIGVKLDPKRSSLAREEVRAQSAGKISLSPLDQEIIRVTQGSLPLTSNPFEVYAKALSISEQELLSRLRWFASHGVLRRVAAIAFHRKLGFQANGMAVWQVPEDHALSMGPKMASFSSISHCYLRETNEHWKHNLFAMIHGKQKEDVHAIIEEVRKEFGLPEALVLFSTREFKKQRILYFSEEAEAWEQKWGMPLMAANEG